MYILLDDWPTNMVGYFYESDVQPSNKVFIIQLLSSHVNKVFFFLGIHIKIAQFCFIFLKFVTFQFR